MLEESFPLIICMKVGWTFCIGMQSWMPNIVMLGSLKQHAF